MKEIKNNITSLMKEKEESSGTVVTQQSNSSKRAMAALPGSSGEVQHQKVWHKYTATRIFNGPDAMCGETR